MRIKYEPKYAYGHFCGTLRGLPIIDQKKCQYGFSGIYMPGSSKCVKFVPFHKKKLPKGRIFTYLEDPGITLSHVNSHKINSEGKRLRRFRVFQDDSFEFFLPSRI